MLDAKSRGHAVPPKDTLGKKLSLIPLVPAALMKDAQYIKGVPNSWPAVGKHLKARTGHDFPLFSRLSSSFLGKRATSAVATVLIDNLDTSNSVASVPVKILTGAIFAHLADSAELAADFAALAKHHGIPPEDLDGARALASAPTGVDPCAIPALNRLSVKSRHYLLLARALAPSPAEVSSPLVKVLQEARLEPKGIIEVVNFVAVAQLLLRMGSYFNK